MINGISFCLLEGPHYINDEAGSYPDAIIGKTVRDLLDLRRRAGAFLQEAADGGAWQWAYDGLRHNFDWVSVESAGAHLDSLITEWEQKKAGRKAKRLHSNIRRSEYMASRSALVLQMLDAGIPHCCAECGATADITIDHITALSRGGTDEMSNLRFLCRSCNSRKGDRAHDLRPNTVIDGTKPPEQK